MRAGFPRIVTYLTFAWVILGCAATPLWEEENPVKPLPVLPLGLQTPFSALAEPPTPERVRLGKWLFFDKRLSADGTVSCATCHRPEFAFSEPTAISTGIRGQKGGRKAPPVINLAWTLFPHFFWDGRASSLEEQALGPIANPIEMGNTHDAMVSALNASPGYARYFKEAFGDELITKERVAKAVADYERTRLSGNSAWDRWQNGDEKAVSDAVKFGHEVFFGKAACNQCHLGPNFTDTLFHNLGIGWDAKKKKFADVGRFTIEAAKENMGAFKTPTLREVTKHAPYMHDGSVATLREVVEHYNRGGIKNPNLSPKIRKLNLTEKEVEALVLFMEALEGVGYRDTPPSHFPN